MNGVKSFDDIVDQIDRMLSNRRLKLSLRRELERMRKDLLKMRDEARRSRQGSTAMWFIQIASLLARVSELLDRHRN